MIGGSDAALIMRSCTADGKLLQPDFPARRVDTSIFHDAGILPSGPEGEVWSTASTVSDLTYGYLLAVNTNASSLPLSDVIPGFPDTTMYMWESNSSSAPLLRVHREISIPATDKSTFNLWTIAPTLSNGWIFMGEARTKWVPISRDRFQNIYVFPDVFFAEFVGSPGEEVELWFAKEGEKPVSTTCTVTESGAMRLEVPSKTCVPL